MDKRWPDSVGGAARSAKRVVLLLRRLRSDDRWTRAWAAYGTLDAIRHRVMPEYRLTDFGKSWFEDEEFFSRHYALGHGNDLNADRKYFLRELLKLVASLDGDTAEAGVYGGASSWFICEARRGRDSRHWAFDSFAGLSSPGQHDGTYWQAGHMTATEAQARALLEPYGAQVLRGWIPEVFHRSTIDRLAFGHIDVDLYEPTLASLEFFYPRLVRGGILLCDDYGFITCPGARRAVDEFMAGRPEPVVHCPTGQGFIIKE